MDANPEDSRLDAELVASAKDGDTAAFERLLERHEGRVLRVLRLLGVPPSDRDDVAQEVFVRVFRHFDGFRRGRPFGGWIYRISVNAAHDHRARMAKRQAAEVAWTDDLERSVDSGPGPGEMLERRDRQRRLEGALERLSERARAVFVLCELEGLETREVAGFLGISSITVRRHLGRARRELEDALEQVEESSSLD